MSDKLPKDGRSSPVSLDCDSETFPAIADAEIVGNGADDSVSFDSADTADGIIIRFVPDSPPAPPADSSGGGETPSTAVASDEKRELIRRNKQRAIEEDLTAMIAANRKSRPAGIYSGFLLTETASDVLPEERAYAGVFLPLQTAIKYPELLAFETLHYTHAYCNETLPPDTLTVVRPGDFQRLSDSGTRPAWLSPPALVIYSLLGILLGVLAFWLSR